jgi:hypothetical protein
LTNIFLSELGVSANFILLAYQKLDNWLIYHSPSSSVNGTFNINSNIVRAYPIGMIPNSFFERNICVNFTTNIIYLNRNVFSFFYCSFVNDSFCVCVCEVLIISICFRTINTNISFLLSPLPFIKIDSWHKFLKFSHMKNVSAA